ncbi:hypothetical protein ACLOJK_036668 [Asimina triloba]
MKIINNSPDSMLEWKSRFFFAWLASKRHNWGILDWWEEIFLELVSALVVGLAASQRLALMYLRGRVLRWFSSKEEFLCRCEASAHLIVVVPVPSLPEVERKHGKKKRLRKRVHLSIEGDPLEEFFIGVEADSLVEPDPSSEGLSEHPPLEGTPQVIELEEERGVSLLREQVALLKSREVKLVSECKVVWSEEMRL